MFQRRNERIKQNTMAEYLQMEKEKKERQAKEAALEAMKEKERRETEAARKAMDARRRMKTTIYQ